MSVFGLWLSTFANIIISDISVSKINSVSITILSVIGSFKWLSMTMLNLIVRKGSPDCQPANRLYGIGALAN